MPIFEYRCLDCENQFEKIVLGSSEEAECPSCHSVHAEKLLSAFAVGGGLGSSPSSESGPCHCGAPRRGMCGDLVN